MFKVEYFSQHKIQQSVQKIILKNSIFTRELQSLNLNDTNSSLRSMQRNVYKVKRLRAM